MAKISVVINTLNEGHHLASCIKSVKNLADEILVCDMHSDDDSVAIAKKLGAKVIFHKRLSFVEPARNFATSKATGDWILVLDPDEEISQSLSNKLKEIAEDNSNVTNVETARKNMVFNKWVKASMWWPDYHVRFFKKGAVKWSDLIHVKPEVVGQGLTLQQLEEYAIIHHHYTSVSQFIERLNRYTNVQAKELCTQGVAFKWSDLIQKPLNEFLSRFFANKGYLDGVHGLALSMLQAFSFLIVYLKLWEMQGFKEGSLSLGEMEDQIKVGGRDLKYWFRLSNLSSNPVKRIIQKTKHKLFD